jgi:arginase
VLLVAPRDLDPGERDNLAASQVALLEYQEVREFGLALKLQHALEELQARTGEIYLHLDVDVLDHDEAPANGYSTPGGLPLAELEAGIREIARRFTVRAATLSAYDPACDQGDRTLRAGLRLMRVVAKEVSAATSSNVT